MAESTSAPTSAPAPAVGAPPAVPAQKIRHEWFQTETEVNISIFVRNVPRDSLSCDIQPRSISVLYKLPTAGSEGAFDLDPLPHEVVPEQSSFKALASKIEVSLAKKAPGIKWSKIEGEDDNITGYVASAAGAKRTGPSYPTSSRTKKNWDALGKSAEENEKRERERYSSDPNAGGDKDLNDLFKKLYAGATDEQRMAMVKSYQESNGTTLSTDWSNVSKGRVETKPPDSMIAKPWSG